MVNRYIVIIVAAGSGNRFGSDIPKQFAMLAGRPVLMHTIDVFRSSLPQADIVLVLSPLETDRWKSMCSEHNYCSPAVVHGGATRTDSVRNALKTIEQGSATAETLVFIHDGARPLLSSDMLHREINAFAAPEVCAVIPCTPLTDSLMTNTPDDARTVDRSSLVAVQTPQVFRASTILEAYAAMPSDATLTDDASVVNRYAGAKVHLVAGDARNIKITYPLDLKIAELYLNER